MIVRDRPSALRLFLVMRGSVMPNIWKSLLVTALLAIAVTWTHGTLWGHKIAIGAIPFTLMGLPLAIFLGFRNNAAYDRYWEGRKLWGQLLNETRSLTREALTLANGSDAHERARELVNVLCALPHALRHQLRHTDPHNDLAQIGRAHV